MHVQKRIRGNGNALLLCEFADCQASAETCLNSNVNVFKCEHLRSVNLQTAADNGEVVLKDSVHEEITRPPSAIFNHIRKALQELVKAASEQQKSAIALVRFPGDDNRM